jgi:hypothetical protein
VTDAGVKELKAALPQCDITRLGKTHGIHSRHSMSWPKGIAMASMPPRWVSVSLLSSSEWH